MSKPKAECQEQPTLWDIPEEVWPLMQAILDED
jgi:hypothetical protein